ncbi:MAG: ABC transporter ATP-binding protein [bacterium]
MAILEVNNLKAYYITDIYGMVGSVRAVDGISLRIEENEIFGIAGESGCGKTTLIKALAGLIQPPLTVLGGEVDYDFGGEKLDILSLQTEKQRRRIRGAYVSYIPQGSMSVLNPVKKIRRSFHDFIGAHRKIGSREDFEAFVVEHLRHLGLSQDILNAYPHQLSGGMRQRVTIALATILKPKLIIADEPSTALDVVTQRSVIQLLKKIKEEQKNTVILVTHDMAIHAKICDRVAIMYAGEIVEEARVNDIFKDARHPYAKYLMASLPSIGDKSYKLSVPGAPPSLVDPPEGCRFHPRCPEAKEICRTESPELIDIGNGHKVACFIRGDSDGR